MRVSPYSSENLPNAKVNCLSIGKFFQKMLQYEMHLLKIQILIYIVEYEMHLLKIQILLYIVANWFLICQQIDIE